MTLPSDKSIEQLSHELLAGAAGLASSARRVLRWQAALWCLAMAAAVLGVLLVGDMLLRREELGLRILSLLAWVAAILWGAFRWLKPAWQFAPTPLEVAKWIERGQPELSGQLSTAVELAGLPVDEVRYGSRGFREFALRQWSTQGKTPNWNAHLDTEPVRRAALMCVALLFVLGGLLVVWPAEMRVALTRLAMPWSTNHWPQRDQLAFRNPPTIVALGSELQLEVIDNRPPLPERVELQTRLPGKHDATPLSSLQTIQVNEMAVGNLPAVSAAIEVRAVGGDDRSMQWHRIDVVQPPELTEYQFVVEPPGYSGLPATEVVGRRIGVLAGSRVEFRGRFNEPMKRVDVQVLEPQSTSGVDVPSANSVEPQTSTPAGSAPAEWTARLDSDARQLRIGSPQGTPLMIEHSLNWQLSIVTAGGLEMQLPEQWRIEVTEDAPPLIALQTAEMAEISANARLAVRGMASDDLGLTEVVARMVVEGAETDPPATLPIWASPLPTPNASGGTEPRRELAIDEIWNIPQASSLMASPLVAGQRISVWLEARDTSGQWSRSAMQGFAIREPQDLVDSIQHRQNQLLSKVRELVDTQRRNSQLFSRATELMRQANSVQREQLDLMRNVAQVQRAIEQQFQAGSDTDGLNQDVAKLRELLVQNRLDATELAQEIDALQSTISELGAGALRTATQTSEESLQQSQTLHADRSSPTLAQSEVNDRTTAAQSAALRGLEGLLDRLARNEAVQQVQRELAQILNQQNTLRRETDQLQLERLSTTNADELRAKQTALGADQLGLARRLDDLVRRAGELQSTASADQQSLKTQLERATQSLTSSQASAKMRRSTEEIRGEKLAQAAMTQQEVAQLLSQTLQQLGAGNSSQLGSLLNRADGLRQSGQELSQLATEQSSLAEQWSAADAAREQPQLLREQTDLQQRTSAQAGQAAQSGDANLASQIEDAVGEQQTAHSAGAQSDFPQAAQAARRAAQQLAQSAEQLQHRAEQLEQQVAEQQMSELTTAVGQLAAEQRPVAEQFMQLSHNSADEQPEVRQAAIRETASRQEVVRQTLRDVRTKTSQLPTFDWTLEQAELSMSRAVAAAQRYRVQPDANEAADDALRLLELAAAAMQNDAVSPDSASDNPADADSAEPSPAADRESAPPRPLPVIASLKLLRALQQEINLRTMATEATADNTRRSQKLNELSLMQQALGQQIEQLLREFAAANDTGPN